MVKKDKKPDNKKKVLAKRKFSPISLDEEKKKIEEKQNKKSKFSQVSIHEKEKNKFSQVSLHEKESELESKAAPEEISDAESKAAPEEISDAEEIEEEKDLQDFSQFVSEGNFVEVAPNVSKVLTSSQKPIENLEEEFGGGFESGEKKEEEEGVKDNVSEKPYQQSDDARAYQESHQGEEVVLTRGIQQGSVVEIGSGLSPRIDSHVSLVRFEGMSRERGMEDVAKTDYLSASDIENERDVHKIERRKYEL